MVAHAAINTCIFLVKDGLLDARPGENWCLSEADLTGEKGVMENITSAINQNIQGWFGQGNVGATTAPVPSQPVTVMSQGPTTVLSAGADVGVAPPVIAVPQVQPISETTAPGDGVAEITVKEEEEDPTKLATGVFDDLINRTALTVEEYAKVCAAKPLETRGMSITEKLYWNYPRRWKCALYNVSLLNLLPDDLNAFLEFALGTDRDEYRVEVLQRCRIQPTPLLRP